MRQYPDPATDGTLLNLKWVATSGRRERGPLYDEGALAVIGQIEQEGSFTPSRYGLISLVCIEQRTGGQLLTAEERAEAERILRDRGWSLEQGFDYACGVKDAESLLSHFKRDESGT